MKIELCEDNGCLNDGKPTLVVLVVTRDDGKQIRLPYEATKTIQQLYQDIASFIPSQKIPIQLSQSSEEMARRYFDHANETADKIVSQIATSNVIGLEDIVRCVKKHPREEGADDDLTVGHEYRVIFVKKEKGQVSYYDVLDDKADNKYRIMVLPDEIELVRKRQPKTRPVKKEYKQELMKCECGEMNALDFIDGRFQGTCEKCGCLLQKDLQIAESINR